MLLAVLRRRQQVRLEMQGASRDQDAEPPRPNDPVAAVARSRAQQVVNQATDLKHQLKQKRRFRWAYTEPWILLAGDSAAVTALMPELAAKGWQTTDDAVLLWGGLTADGRLDELWLRQIRRLRRSRPLDAIALVLDDTMPLPEYAHEKNRWSLHLARIAEILRWSAPVYVVDAAGADSVHCNGTPVTGCELNRPVDASVIETVLLELRDRLADRSVYQLADNHKDTYASELSKRLDTRGALLARWIASLSDWQRRPLPIAGAFFVPLPAGGPSTATSDNTRLPLWRHLADVTRYTPGRRLLSHPVTVTSTIALVVIGLWTSGMLIAGMNNAHEVMLTSASLQKLDRASDTPTRLRALLGLQQRIGLHEARAQEHTPLLTRFGLNHDGAVLDALWTPYARAARPLLVAPVQQEIEDRLVDLARCRLLRSTTRATRWRRMVSRRSRPISCWPIRSAPMRPS